MSKNLSRQEILARHPIPSTTLDKLRVSGRIRSIKDPHRHGAHLYCDADVVREVKKREKALPNDCVEFTSGGVRWIARQRALDNYGLTSPRLDRWIEKRYVEARLKRIKGNNPARRRFVHAGQLEAMIAGHPHARIDRDWLTAEEAFREFQFGEPFLRKIAREPHRLLKRKVRTGRRFVPSGHGVWKTTFCRFDLQTLHKMIHKPVPPPPGWVTAEKAQSLGLSAAVLYYYRTHPCRALGGKKLTAKPRAVPKLAAGGTFTWYYLLSELKEIARRKGYRPGQAERKYRDTEANTWWPAHEASEMIQEHPGRLWDWGTKPCPHLGRPIRHKRVRLRLHHSKYGDFAEVYHEDDLQHILDRKSGLDVSVPPLTAPAPAQSKSPKTHRKRGRQPVEDKEVRRRLDVLRDWERARATGTRLKEFLLDRNIADKTFHRYQSWGIGHHGDSIK